MRKMHDHQSTHWVGCGCDGGPSHYDCLRGEFTLLRARIAELERDRERLNWLANRMQVETLPPEPVYIVEIPMHDCPDPRDANLRAAIDAARTPEAGDGE